MILYQDFNSHFYSYNINNFYESVGPRGVNIKGPIWRPVRLIMNLILTVFLLVVPVFYGIIFRYFPITTNFFKDRHIKRNLKSFTDFDASKREVQVLIIKNFLTSFQFFSLKSPETKQIELLSNLIWSMATKLDDVHFHPSGKREREEEKKREQQTFNESQFSGLGLRGGKYKNFIIGFDKYITFSFWEPFLLFCPLFWAEMESSLDGVSSAQRWFLSDSKLFLDIFLLQFITGATDLLHIQESLSWEEKHCPPSLKSSLMIIFHILKWDIGLWQNPFQTYKYVLCFMCVLHLNWETLRIIFNVFKK